jgi:hypothetical protein
LSQLRDVTPESRELRTTLQIVQEAAPQRAALAALETRADVEPGRADPEAKEVGDAPAPIDQLLVRELRRQGDTKQRDDDRDNAGGGPLPAGAETLVLAAVLDQKGDGADRSCKMSVRC